MIQAEGRLYAGLVLLLGLLLRLKEASHNYLNPDEASYCLYSTPSSVKQLYLAILHTHHPPLLFFVLHAAMTVSSSEIALRLMPVFAGAASGWVMYRWLARVWSVGAGLAAMVILMMSPDLITLSSQARSYSLLLLFAALALAALDAAIDKKSAGQIALFSAWLYLAILTEYSAAFFVAAVGIYFLLRARQSGISRGLFLAWAASQAGALCLYAALYRTSMQHLMNTAQAVSTDGFLRNGFPQAHVNLPIFAAVGTIRQFSYVFASAPMGCLAALAFGAGLIILWGERRALAVFLVLPFVFAIAAAAAGMHPYFRSRHTVILSLSIAAGVGVAVDRLVRSRARAAGILTLAIMAVGFTIAQPDQHDIQRSRRSRAVMITAIEHLCSSVPAGSVVLVEGQAIDMLDYYLRGSGSYRFVYRRYQWLDASSLMEDAAAVRQEFGMAQEQPLWVVEAGWQVDVDEKLRQLKPSIVLPGFQDFDRVLVLFKLPPVKSAA